MTTVQAMMAGAILAWAPTILVFIYICLLYTLTLPTIYSV